MNEEEYVFTSKFEDLSECTEFYYNELGKLSCVTDLTRRERRRLRKKIVDSMFAAIKELNETAQFEKTVNSGLNSEEYMRFKEEHKKEKNNTFLKAFKKFFNKKDDVEVIQAKNVKKIANSKNQKGQEEGNDLLAF